MSTLLRIIVIILLTFWVDLSVIIIAFLDGEWMLALILIAILICIILWLIAKFVKEVEHASAA